MVELSGEAEAILLRLADSKDGMGIRGDTLMGYFVAIDGFNPVPDDTPRTAAKWKRAVDELENYGFVEFTSASREPFKITAEGYDFADKLKKLGES